MLYAKRSGKQVLGRRREAQESRNVNVGERKDRAKISGAEVARRWKDGHQCQAEMTTKGATKKRKSLAEWGIQETKQ